MIKSVRKNADNCLSCYLEERKNAHLNDRSNEFLQKSVFQKRRPVMVYEVNQQAFDVRAILILKYFQKKAHECYQKC